MSTPAPAPLGLPLLGPGFSSFDPYEMWCDIRPGSSVLPQFFLRKKDGSTPLTGRQPKLDAKPGRDQMPEGSEIRRLDAYRIPPSPMEPGAGVSPAAFWLLCRRGQSNPRRSAELPEKTLIRRLDAHRIPPSPIRQRIPKPLVLAIFWLLFNRLKSNPPVGAGTHKRIEKKNPLAPGRREEPPPPAGRQIRKESSP